MTAPGFRPEAFERVRTAYETRLDQVSATPGGVLGHNLMQLEHDGDVRWRQPDKAEIANAKLSDLEALLRDPLANGDIEVVVVGDVTVDRAAAAVAATFGALPPRKSETLSAKALEVRFPGPKQVPPALKHTGRADQAIAMLAWRTDDFYADTQRARAVRLAEQILRIRLTEQFRIAEGNTYSPGTDFEASEVFPHYGYVAARVETPPAKIPRFFDEVMKIAADMRSKGVTADELERARKPRIEALERAQQTNGYWSSALGGASRDPRRLQAIRDTITGMQKVTAEDVKKAAEMYLTDDRAWKLAVLPETPGAPS
jgi:zinc protease